jgi:hypothetical protein
MSIRQLSLACLCCLMCGPLSATRVAAQAAPSDPTPSQPPASMPVDSSQPGSAQAPAPADAVAPADAAPSGSELLVPSSDELQVPREGPPPSNPYPTNRGVRPRRWSAADTARVRLMLEAERARRRRVGAEPSAPPQAPPPLAPVLHGDAGAAIGIGLSVDAIFHNDVGFRLFDQRKASSRLGIWASHDLATLQKRWILSGELGFGVDGNDSSDLFNGDVQAHLSSSTFHGALSLRWDACSIFAPHVRAAGGVSLMDLELSLNGEPNETDHAVSGFGALGAGFLLHTPARLFENRAGKLASLSLGIMFEAGYALRSPVDFALKNHGDARSIDIVNAKLGRLDLSGTYLRTSLVARF